MRRNCRNGGRCIYLYIYTHNNCTMLSIYIYTYTVSILLFSLLHSLFSQAKLAIALFVIPTASIDTDIPLYCMREHVFQEVGFPGLCAKYMGWVIMDTILSYPILSYPILSYPILSSPILSIYIPSYLSIYSTQIDRYKQTAA